MAIIATTCCVGAAKCMYELGDYAEALQWVSQVNVLQRHAQVSTTEGSFADIYIKLGNTGAAVENHWTATCTRGIVPALLLEEAMKGVPVDAPGMARKIHLQRHPDPELAHRQVKLNSRGLSSRLGCGIFVYNGYFYAFGGEKALEGPFFPELWRIKLKSLGGSVVDWQRLPSYPFANSTSNYTGFPMALNRKDHKAYLFIGSQDMRYFDTKNGVIHCIDGKLYVFGGINPTSPIGTDLFMVLDIETKVWRLLSGSAIPKPSFSSPGPREHACSWVGKGGKKLYTIPRVPTESPQTNEVFDYADAFMLDSDDPSISSWRHVLTRGFPIYRAQSQLLVDEATGKNYLFSGYTNSEFVPGQKHLVSRSFSDIWQLRLDMPGGFFEAVDVEVEALTAKAGPWKRCFGCGSAGMWQKCGGTLTNF
ncbi:hypothetical protein CPB85DRAFT_1320281 [Mucidula mucida]|nr:hypothetical protein CPB85DRAFT_1320281 [Mucidula mucida]